MTEYKSLIEARAQISIWWVLIEYRNIDAHLGICGV